MSKNMPQRSPISEQHGRKPGQNPLDINQDRDTDRREQRNMDDGYDKKRGNDQTKTPKPEDPKRPATKPQGTTDDQINNMESEGQAQEAVEPQEPPQEPAPKRSGTP